MDNDEIDYQDYDIEEWEGSPDTTDTPYDRDDDVIFMAPRIIQGQEDRIHFSAESGYGLLSTTAEGEIGKKIKKISLLARTDEEKFRDNILKLSNIYGIEKNIQNDILKLIPKIPDIKYKSPIGCLLGLMTINIIDKPKLSNNDIRELDKIKKLIETIKQKEQKISILDAIRYARLIKTIIKPQQIQN